MKRGKLVYVSLAMGLLALVLVFGCAKPAPAPKVVEVRICGQMPVGHFDIVAVERFIEDAEKRSNGTLHFTHYPAGQLYTEHDLVDVLPAGGVEMAQIGLDRHIGRVPEGHFIYPYLIPEDWYFRWWYDTANGGGLYYSIMKPAFAKDNIHLLSTLNYAPDYAIITNKPVHKPADYKGLKLRTSGKALGAVVEALEAKAIVMSSADVYMAIQRGTIDGALSGASSFVSRKWYEIADYVQYSHLGNIPFGFAANLDFWNSLTPEQQNAINEATRTMEIWAVTASIEDNDKCFKTMKDAGLEIWEFSEEEQAEMRESGIAAVKSVVEPDVGEATWNAAMRLLNNVKDAKPTWQEILKTRKF